MIKKANLDDGGSPEVFLTVTEGEITSIELDPQGKK